MIQKGQAARSNKMIRPRLELGTFCAWTIQHEIHMLDNLFLLGQQHWTCTNKGTRLKLRSDLTQYRRRRQLSHSQGDNQPLHFTTQTPNQNRGCQSLIYPLFCAVSELSLNMIGTSPVSGNSERLRVMLKDGVSLELVSNLSEGVRKPIYSRKKIQRKVSGSVREFLSFYITTESCSRKHAFIVQYSGTMIPLGAFFCQVGHDVLVSIPPRCNNHCLDLAWTWPT
ncbi:hypothetical protein PM082_021850 [Marasmius tenuissimus]|nr:hypothetical protein PM082_021850 [Marasmius tenuissimus]